ILYLGLGPDEEYDSYGAYADNQPAPDDAPELVFDETPPEPTQPSALSNVRPLTDPSSTAAPEAEPAAAPTPPSRRPSAVPSSPVVRTLPPVVTAKPSTIAPVSFNEAQEIGDRYAANQPVIVNLQGADRELARRLIDFASGLCYGLGGEMERVANQVYLLTPADVELPEDERRRLMGGSSTG
ncbi:MAG: cell division protein SepF, partial [Acidimicrobiales bacterium]